MIHDDDTKNSMIETCMNYLIKNDSEYSSQVQAYTINK